MSEIRKSGIILLFQSAELRNTKIRKEIVSEQVSIRCTPVNQATRYAAVSQGMLIFIYRSSIVACRLATSGYMRMRRFVTTPAKRPIIINTSAILPRLRLVLSRRMFPVYNVSMLSARECA